MKTNCHVLRGSIFISIIVFIFLVVLLIININCDCKLIEIIMNIIIGVFGSSIVALFLAIPAYKYSKTELLNKYTYEVSEIIKQLYELKYLYNEFDNETLLKYIDLECRKEKCKKVGLPCEDINESLKICKEKLVEQYINNHSNSFEDLIEKKDNANKSVDNSVEKIRINVKKICSQYIDFSNIKIIHLKNLIFDMEFLLGNKKKEKIYNITYKPILDLLNDLKEKEVHLKLFLDGEGNEFVALSVIFDIQKEIFDVIIDENDQILSYKIFNKFADKIVNNNDDISCMLYGSSYKSEMNNPIFIKTYMK